MKLEDFEWDEDKNEKNFQKHGIDFASAPDIFNEPMYRKLDTRNDYKENRWRALGSLFGTPVIVAYTYEGQKIRIFHIRKAKKYEIKRKRL